MHQLKDVHACDVAPQLELRVKSIELPLGDAMLQQSHHMLPLQLPAICKPAHQSSHTSCRQKSTQLFYRHQLHGLQQAGTALSTTHTYLHSAANMPKSSVGEASPAACTSLQKDSESTSCMPGSCTSSS